MTPATGTPDGPVGAGRPAGVASPPHPTLAPTPPATATATLPAPLPALVGLAVILLLAAGCGPTGEPRIEVGRAQASVPIAGASQVVVDIHNRGDGDDRLIAAETDAALDTELHLTEIADSRATMATIDEIDVPAGERVRFRPGGLHLMLVLPDETVVAGGTFDLQLRFDRSDPVTVPVEVVDLLDLVESSDEDR